MSPPQRYGRAEVFPSKLDTALVQIVELTQQLADVGDSLFGVSAFGPHGYRVATRGDTNLELLLDETQRLVVVRCNGLDDFGIECNGLHGSGAPVGATTVMHPPDEIGGTAIRNNRLAVPPLGHALPAFPPLTHPD